MQLLCGEALQAELDASEQMLLIPLHQHSPASQMSLLNEQLLPFFYLLCYGSSQA